MTKLPAKALLDGSKLPKTTTSEMKGALGDVRDYLVELLGEDSENPEAARKALGVEAALAVKADKEEIDALKEEMGKDTVPVGTVATFAMSEPPAGYLRADGAAVSRTTYPALFAAIGTTFGEGDGTTTFNLPDLMGRFAEGSRTPGQIKDAGLPNITGGVHNATNDTALFNQAGTRAEGVFALGSDPDTLAGNISDTRGAFNNHLTFDASRSSAVYGASDTVQPAALTLLPCIKAFGAPAPSGLVGITELAQEVAGKLALSGGTLTGDLTVKGALFPVHAQTGQSGRVHVDENGAIALDNSVASLALGRDSGLYVNGNPVPYVNRVEAPASNWCRRWSDGVMEQGGVFWPTADGWQQFTYPVPFERGVYTVLMTGNSTGTAVSVGEQRATGCDFWAVASCYVRWYAYGY